jgi:hypothetical protein
LKNKIDLVKDFNWNKRSRNSPLNYKIDLSRAYSP